MKILFFGDIYGKPGREVIKKILPQLRNEHKPDFVIANVENVTHGRGVSALHLAELRGLGIDAFTSGNHIFALQETENLLSDKSWNLLRPANYPEGAPGHGDMIIERNGKQLLLINIMGRVYMGGSLDCPFQSVDAILKKHENEAVDATFIDFHAETTSEKIALQWHLDGRVSAVVGTHTHVQTADARVLSQGTAVITDVGMNGPADGCIGVNREIILRKFISGMPERHDVAPGTVLQLAAVVVKIENKKALSIQPIISFFS